MRVDRGAMNCPGCDKPMEGTAGRCKSCDTAVSALVEARSQQFFKDPVWGHLAANSKFLWFIHGSKYQNKIQLSRGEIQKLSVSDRALTLQAVSSKYGEFTATFSSVDGGAISPDLILMLKRFEYLL